MRIGLVAREWHKRAGPERAFAELAEHLAGRDHDVTVYASRVTDLDLLHLTLRRLPAPSRPGWADRLGFLLSTRLLLRQSRHDVVLALGPCCPGVPVVRVGRVQAARLPTDSEGHLKPWGEGLTGRVELAFERRVFRTGGITALVATEALRRQLETYYPRVAENALVLPNGVDLSVFSRRQAPKRRSSIREALGIPETRQVALFVGGEFEERGLGLAVDLLEKLDELSLLVLGGRVEDLLPYRERARTAATADRLYHIPHTDQPATFYAAADVFVLPRAGDGFPLAVLEALASGLPVVVAESAATRELLADSGAGQLLESELKAFEQALGRLMREPGERQQMGREALALSKQYDWERVVVRFEQTLNSLSVAGS